MSSNETTSGSRSTQHHRHAPHASLTPAPPGFELIFKSEQTNLKNCFDAFIVSVHWAIIRGGLRLRVTDTPPMTKSIPINELSETLPANWTTQIVSKPEEGTEQIMKEFVLRYWEQSNSEIHYEAKIKEIVKNQSVVVIFFRAVNAYGMEGNVQAGNKKDIDSNSPTRNSCGRSFELHDHILYDERTGELGSAINKSWYDIYKNVDSFETIVWEQLMEPIGLSITNKPNANRTNEPVKETPGQSRQTNLQESYTPMTRPPPSNHPYPQGGIGGPLYVPPGIPTGGGLGRSDLDPIGGFGTGMVADPRGFRQPALPFGPGPGAGGLMPPPPGARFDPFGPPNPMPNQPLRPQPGGGNWAVPNPDAEQPPPGFDDMFM